MSDLAPLLLPRAPLPRHLYGTRAALFYLLRETPEPAALAPSPLSMAVVHPLRARVVPTLPEPARPSLRDLLQSDSFDFRGLGDAV